MATYFIYLFALLFLIFSALQGCCGSERVSPDLEEAASVAVMRDIAQTLRSIDDNVREGLRLHAQNTDSIRSVLDSVLQVKEVLKGHENIKTLTGEEETLKKVVLLTQENSDLKLEVSKKDCKVHELTQEIMDLKNQLEDKNKKVKNLTRPITGGRRQRYKHDQKFQVDTPNDEESRMKKKVADKNVTVLGLQESREIITTEKEQNGTKTETQEAVGWAPECERQPRLQQIAEVVWDYTNITDWDTLNSGLEPVLDHSSEEYSQMQRADSLLSVGSYGYSQLASLLLCAGLPADTTDSGGDTMMQGAAHGGQVQLAQLLLDRGADINGKGLKDRTPLMLAATSGNMGMVQWLVQAGADTTVENKDGNTAIYYAGKYGHTEIVQYLEQLPH